MSNIESVTTANILLQVLYNLLSPADLISLSKVSRVFHKSKATRFALIRVKENLVKIISVIYGYDPDRSKQFMTEMLQETYFFGSSLVLALISAVELEFTVGDLDLVCVLTKEFRAHNWMKRTSHLQSLTNVCCGRHKDHESRVEKHKQMANLLMMPGETCENVNLAKFQNTRKWFGPMNMILRKMYNPTIGHFCAMSRNICVASPFEKKTTDIVFIHNCGKKSAIHFAWRHVKKTPFFPGVNLIGMNHEGKLTLKIANLEMLQTRMCIIPSNNSVCHSPTNGLSVAMFDYLKKYVEKNICKLVFEFDLDSLASVDNMATVMGLARNMKTKRIPEDSKGIVKFIIYDKSIN